MHLINNSTKLFNAAMMILLLTCASGCSSYGKGSLILRRDEKLFSIVPGSKIQTVNDGEILAPEDLIAMYKGNLLRLEEEANSRVIKTARTGKRNNAIWGFIASLFSIIATIMAKRKITRQKGRK